MKLACGVISICVALTAGNPVPTLAQDIFPSTQSPNLPTTSGLRSGRWLFEISHRFVPAIVEGRTALWGIDGPVYNRLGLAFMPRQGVMVGVQRTNLDDNLELNAKARLLDVQLGDVPIEASAMMGIAWNSDAFAVEGVRDNESQFYLQAIVNARVLERVAVGVVPTWIRNPRIRDVDVLNAIAVGLQGQVVLSSSVSALVEWVISEDIQDRGHDTGTFGVEFRTRGHFFKLLVTNQVLMNPTQYLAGSFSGFQLDELRFGFNVQRVLSF